MSDTRSMEIDILAIQSRLLQMAKKEENEERQKALRDIANDLHTPLNKLKNLRK